MPVSGKSNDSQPTPRKTRPLRRTNYSKMVVRHTRAKKQVHVGIAKLRGGPRTPPWHDNTQRLVYPAQHTSIALPSDATQYWLPNRAPPAVVPQPRYRQDPHHRYQRCRARKRSPSPLLREGRRTPVRHRHDHPLQPRLPAVAVETVCFHVPEDAGVYRHRAFEELFTQGKETADGDGSHLLRLAAKRLSKKKRPHITRTTQPPTDQR